MIFSDFLNGTYVSSVWWRRSHQRHAGVELVDQTIDCRLWVAIKEE